MAANNTAGKQSLKQKLRSDRNCLSIGTWNVCTLVESLGDESVCRKVNKPGTVMMIESWTYTCEGAKEVWDIHRRDSRDQMLWK